MGKTSKTKMSQWAELLKMYLSGNSTDISKESNSWPHIIAHLLSTKVNLQTDHSEVISLQLLQHQIWQN